MKKSFVIFLTVLFMVVLAGTSFAASPALIDVPTTHWAYDAVSKLVKADLVDGYGDATFRGDRPMSRYELAIIVAKSMDRYDRADETNQQLIDKLSAEFASELNHMGIRLAKVEAKTNTWIGGETRMRWVTDHPGNGGIKKMHGSDNFDFRQRIKFSGTINDQMTWTGRIATNAQNKWGNFEQTAGSDISLDMMNITMSKTLGLDTIRLGRSAIDYVGYGGLIGRPGNSDGVLLKNKFGDVQFQGYVGNIKSDGATSQGNAAGDSGRAYTLSTGQLGFNLNKDLHFLTGYYWADVPGTSTGTGTGTMNTNVGSYDRSKGVIVGLDYKIGQYTFLADYLSTSLDNATGVPGNPKGWAVQISNSKGPKVFFPAVLLVDPKKEGTDSWLIGYRSIDPGTVPGGAGGFDTTAVAYASQPYSVYTHGTDNVKGLYLAYQKVLAKSFVLTFEYQDIKVKNKALTTLSSSDLNRTFQTKFEFFY